MCTLRTTFSLEGQALNGSLKADTEPAEQPRELSPVFCDDLEEWDGRVGRRLRKDQIFVADSCCRPAETSTTL